MIFPHEFSQKLSQDLVVQIESAPEHEQTLAFLIGPDLIKRCNDKGIAWNSPGIFAAVLESMEVGGYRGQVAALGEWRANLSEAQLVCQRLTGESTEAYDARMRSLLGVLGGLDAQRGKTPTAFRSDGARAAYERVVHHIYSMPQARALPPERQKAHDALADEVARLMDQETV